MTEAPRLREANLRLRPPGAKRRERDTLGFLRQPMVRWLSPPILVRAAIEVAVSSAFGKFADKRESQTILQQPLDLSQRGELWIDYLSDTGDGFEATYTLARLLSAPQLDVSDDHRLQRGDLLLLGGDQVYPAASPEAYEDRFLGPFGTAFPSTQDGAEPSLFAIPGNHDWYDGLTSFLRIFGQRGEIGAWRKRQVRSYYALALPHRWRLWAIDIQLDTYLDKPQLDYFAEAARDLEGSRVILLTAKPSWVKARPGRLEPPSWKYLAQFEQEMISDKGGELVLTVTGDIHHYARYEPVSGGRADRDRPRRSDHEAEAASMGQEQRRSTSLPTRLTAGGGGAYLSGTHTLPPELKLRVRADGSVATYRCETTYPMASLSRRLTLGVLRLPWTNPGFGGLMAVIYLLIAAAAWAGLGVQPDGLVGAITASDFPGFLASAASASTISLAVGLGVLLALYADLTDVRPALIRWLGKTLAGLLHASLHLAAVAAVLYGLAAAVGQGLSGAWFLPLSLVCAAGAGYLAGSLIFALVLLLLHWLLRRRAPQHANEVFASQGIVDYKNFLRLHLAEDGRLTVYPLAIDRICRRWRFAGRSSHRAWFEPIGKTPSARLIEDPLSFAAPEPSRDEP